jgi:hypothetical protein
MYKEFLDTLSQDCDAIMLQARQEYASDDDPLQNFERRAAYLGLTPRQVLLSDLLKHVISMCKGVSLRESMRGRIIDGINYMRLLALMEAQTPSVPHVTNTPMGS